MTRSVVVDARWGGLHGIGRYAREVVDRLTVDHTELSAGEASMAADVVLPARLRLPADTVLYVPRYNAGPSRARQLLTIFDLIHLDAPGESSAVKRAYYQRIARPVIRRTGVVLTISRTSAERIREWVGPDVEVVDAGIGLSPAFSRPSLPTEPGISSERPYALYVGPTRTHKSVPTVFAAVAGAPEVDLVLVTKDAQECRELAERHGIADRTRILGGLDDAALATVYTRAAVTVVPSTHEGFGLPAAESLACGTPVLHRVECTAVAEVVGEYGIGVPASAGAAEWTAALRRLIAGEVPAAPADFAARYDWAPVAATVDATITALR